MTNETQLLRRAEASKYLMEKWYTSRTPATLAKLAVTGGGPSFIHIGTIPYYPILELDAYVQSIMSPLKRSTSDNGGENV
ncbi:MAG: hypothetical protein ABL867_09595 [Rickettsiales bacterium]